MNELRRITLFQVLLSLPPYLVPCCHLIFRSVDSSWASSPCWCISEGWCVQLWDHCPRNHPTQRDLLHWTLLGQQRYIHRFLLHCSLPAWCTSTLLWNTLSLIDSLDCLDCCFFQCVMKEATEAPHCRGKCPYFFCKQSLPWVFLSFLLPLHLGHRTTEVNIFQCSPDLL